jgi:hypothetical protein
LVADKKDGGAVGVVLSEQLQAGVRVGEHHHPAGELAECYGCVAGRYGFASPAIPTRPLARSGR